MSLQFEIKISGEDPEIQEFFLNDALVEKKLEPTLDNGFYYPSVHEKEELFPNKSYEFQFPASEYWYVYKRTAPWPAGKTRPHFPEDILLGSNKLTVILSITVVMQVKYYLSLRKGINEQDCEKDLQLLLNYVPVIGEVQEFENYIKEKELTLKEADYTIKPVLTIVKTSALKEADVREREKLQNLYHVPSEYRGQMHTLKEGDYSFSAYVADSNLFLWQGAREELGTTPSPSLPNSEIKEVDFLGDLAALKVPINDLLNKLFPAPCEPMTRKEYKLMSFPALPEFMLEWVSVTVKIGCVRITISVPILRTRTSKLYFYVYYSIFQDAKVAIMGIAENCAKKAAIQGAVVGVVLLNPVAALAEFQSSFQSCIITDIVSCIDAGLYTIKVVGEWT